MRFLKKYKSFLFEAVSTPACNQWADKTWVNGDGVNKPKITITKSESGVTGIYEGPESGWCIQRSQFSDTDTIHQLEGIVVFYEAAPYLKELYNKDIFVRPDLANIKMTYKTNYWKIDIPFVKTTEDQAIMNFNSRGGLGHDGMTQFNILMNDINDEAKAGKYEMVETREGVKSGQLTVNFVMFRNLEKFPISSQSTTQNKSTNTQSTQTTQPTQQSTSSTVPSGEILKVSDVKNLKVGDVLVGTRMTGVKNDVEEPGLYELTVSRNPTFDNRIIYCDVVIDGEKKGLELAWPYQGDNSSKFGGGEDNDPLVLNHNTETGQFVNLRLK